MYFLNIAQNSTIVNIYKRLPNTKYFGKQSSIHLYGNMFGLSKSPTYVIHYNSLTLTLA